MTTTTNDQYVPTEAETTPTLGDLRDAWRSWFFTEDAKREAPAAFDRWIAAHDAEALADEHAKRPDRRQIARALFEADGRRNYDGSPTPWHILDLDEQAHYRKLADAVLSSLALKTETDQELQDRIEVLEKNLAYEVAQKIKLAEQLQAATATDLTLEQARWKMHAGIESRCSEEVAAEVKPVIDLVFSSLALEPETREVTDV